MNLLIQLVTDDTAHGLAEYALVVSLIGTAMMGAISILGKRTTNALSNVVVKLR